MTVHFIGAGPGAADLITVRGRALIERCPVCLYAGSIVPPEMLAWCPPGARLVDTAPLDLDAIAAEFVRAHERGEDVARLHSGDLSIWSALGEQLRRLDALGIPYTITPGVPAFAAAAAALGRELTVPEVGAIGGADPHLRPGLGHAGDGAPRRLRRRRGRRSPFICRSMSSSRSSRSCCPPTAPIVPAAVVWRASWPDERVHQGHARRRSPPWSRAEKLERTALILVGRTLAAKDFRESALYSTDYDRRFRPNARGDSR